MKTLSRPVLALVLLFGGPLVLAVVLYFGPRERPWLGTLPNPDRELIAGATRIPAAPLVTPGGRETEPDWARYRWSVIYARIAPCEAQCLEHLTRLTQVQQALGRDRDRTRRVLLAAGDVPDLALDESLLVGLLDAAGGASLADLLGRERIGRGRFFVVDPLGNVVVSYPPDADQKRMLEDLKRLLEVSRIG